MLALLASACSGSDSVADIASDAANAVSGAADETESVDSDADGDFDEGFDDVEQAESDDGFDEPAVAQGEPQAASGSSAQVPNTENLGREIIFTARLSVGVDSVTTAGAEASQIINDIGGFVFGQETQGGAQPRSEITFKVLPEDFSEALENLGGIGELRNQSITTDDVTERVVDLNSRIGVAELGVERLRNALEDATDLEDFARIEELLLARESDLEVMRGTLRTLRDQIDLATITLILEQDRVENLLAIGISAYEGQDNGARCPANPVANQRFDPGDEITLCVLTRNDGEQTLRDITITETALAIEDNDDLITVFGENELRPGQTFIQAIEIDVERDLFLRFSATGVPTDGTGDEQVAPLVTAQRSPELRVDEDAAAAGFGDGFGAGTELLSRVWTTAIVIAGFLLPLLVLVPFLVLAWWSLRRLRTARATRRQERWEAAQPPPPQQTGTVETAERDEEE